ncbi:hypothetical protein [Sphingobium yanoikuyae]|uniref:hypothetical protein n=1 Tax=Sphingobium yanoikuyae TaxID=13690 RepID=UPI0028AC092B|nr:hypothetical protein [Sphingobium yanoikuyae]
MLKVQTLSFHFLLMVSLCPLPALAKEGEGIPVSPDRNAVRKAETSAAPSPLIANPEGHIDRSAITIQNSQVDARSVYRMTIPDTYNFADNMRSTVHVDERNRGTAQHSAAYGAYVYNQCKRGQAPYECNGVGLFSQAIAGIPSAQNWPINTACNDNGFASSCGNEHDVTVQSSSAVYTLWAGIIQGRVQPGNANGIQLSQVPGAVAQWTYGFATGDGAAQNFGSIGALATRGANIPSQPLWMNSFDRNGRTHAIKIQANDHSLAITDNTLQDGISLSSGNGAVAIKAVGASKDIDFSLTAKGAGTVALGSTLNLADGSTWSAAGMAASSNLDLRSHSLENVAAITGNPDTDLSLSCAGNCSTNFISRGLNVLAVRGVDNAASPGNVAAKLGDADRPWAVAHVRQVHLVPTTFGELPSCTPSLQGVITFINDAKQPITKWHQAVSEGGGQYKAFLSCNGAGWHAFDY